MLKVVKIFRRFQLSNVEMEDFQMQPKPNLSIVFLLPSNLGACESGGVNQAFICASHTDHVYFSCRHLFFRGFNFHAYLLN